MKCARYWQLYRQVAEIGQQIKAADVDLRRSDEYRRALVPLRAHAEICDICIADTIGAFPELAGKRLIMEQVFSAEDVSARSD